MGIGGVITLHGYPDCMIRATNSAVTCLAPSSDDPDSSLSLTAHHLYSNKSDGDHVYTEAKSDKKCFK